MGVTIVSISSKLSVSNVQQSVAFLDKFELSDTKLTESQIADMLALLNRKSDLFVTSDNPSFGSTDMVQRKISLIFNAVPKHQRPNRLPPEKKVVLCHHMDNLLVQGIIAPVIVKNEDLPFTSPTALVINKCKDKTARGRDFRYLNLQTQELVIPFLIRKISELFTELTPNYFTSINLSSGFFQMCISPESTRYTTFGTNAF